MALNGCAFLGSKEVVAACQAADTITTVVGIEVYGAVEVNPIMAVVYNTFGPIGFIASKILVTYVLLHFAPSYPTATAIVNVVTCGAAVNNINVISGMP